MILGKDKKYVTHFSHLRIMSVEISDHYNQIHKRIHTLNIIYYSTVFIKYYKLKCCIYSFVLANKCIKKNIILTTSSNINSWRHSLISKSRFGSPCSKYSRLNEALLYFCKNKIKSQIYSSG